MSTTFSQQILRGKLLLVLNCAFNKQTRRQLKKIVPETVNFGSPNFTKPKKIPRNTKKITKFSQQILFPVVVGLGLIFYFLHPQ